jgi:hypothetical protein
MEGLKRINGERDDVFGIKGDGGDFFSVRDESRN